MMKKTNSLIIILLAVLSFCVLPAFAEYYYDQNNGYAIDLVEGFKIAQKSDTGVFFTSDFIPVELAVNVYEPNRFTDTKQAVKYAVTQLGVKDANSIEEFKWRNTNCSISNFEFVFQDTPCIGWSVSIFLPENNKIVTFFAYTAKENDSICEQVILSCLDGIFIDRPSYFEPGPVTTFVFPKGKELKRTINFKDVKSEVCFDSSDEEAAKYVIEREYAILKALSNTDFWFSSWQRYYQTIYRDSYTRIKNACYAFCNEVYALGADSENPDNAYASNVLEYMQNLPYGRDSKNTDFTNLCSTFLGSTSDCDSRAMLASVMLNMMNVKSTFFVSVEYSHAMVGAVLNMKGASITNGDKKYVLGETTAKVAFGQIAQDMSDPNKWICIPLPE